MLLVFAALAHAEHDEATARQLLLITTTRRTIDFMAYSTQFAEVLGVGPGYNAIPFPQSPDQEAAHQRACIEAVQAEIARRAWAAPRAAPGPSIA